MAISKIGTNSLGNVTDVSSSTTLSLKTAGTTAVTVNASQNVGIGTSSPGTKLQVYNSGSTDTRFSVGNANAGFQVGVESTGACLIANFVSQPISMYTNGTERMRLDASGNLLFNSGYGSVGTAYGCRAWVNFNGTGTVAIRASGNVTSITDNGTGDYTVNFTTAMPDANYGAQLSGRRDSETGDVNHGIVFYSNATYLSSSLRIAIGSANDAVKRDSPTVTVAIFR